jgi:flagellar hook-associated protein 3 FlgL
MVGLANTKFADRFIFGGYQTTTNPFLADGTYRGDNRSIPVEVRDNYYISVNVPGSVPFKGLGRADGIDAFEVLQRLKTGLLKNDTIMIQSTLEDFGRVLNQFNIARASIGAKVKAIDNTMAAVLGDEIDKVKWNSELEDADAAKVFNELNKDEAILKRSMTTSSKMLQPALFDYLR